MTHDSHTVCDKEATGVAVHTSCMLLICWTSSSIHVTTSWTEHPCHLLSANWAVLGVQGNTLTTTIALFMSVNQATYFHFHSVTVISLSASFLLFLGVTTGWDWEAGFRPWKTVDRKDASPLLQWRGWSAYSSCCVIDTEKMSHSETNIVAMAARILESKPGKCFTFQIQTASFRLIYFCHCSEILSCAVPN